MTLQQPSDWERQRQKRIDIVELFKSKPEYQAFSAARSSRPNDVWSPKTPDPTDPCSKSRWETRFGSWKSLVNEWAHDRSERSAADRSDADTSERSVRNTPCQDPRHYALTVCCPFAMLYCSCQVPARQKSPLPVVFVFTVRVQGSQAQVSFWVLLFVDQGLMVKSCESHASDNLSLSPFASLPRLYLAPPPLIPHITKDAPHMCLKFHAIPCVQVSQCLLAGRADLGILCVIKLSLSYNFHFRPSLRCSGLPWSARLQCCVSEDKKIQGCGFYKPGNLILTLNLGPPLRRASWWPGGVRRASLCAGG